MDQELTHLADSLRKAIDAATASQALDHEGYARTLQRALALLWSAHDEITSLRPSRRP